MKKYLSIIFKTLAFISFSILLNGCLKDTCRRLYNYTFYLPVYKTIAQVKANIKSNPSKEIKEPGKIVISGNYIFLNEVNKGIHVIDNTRPSSPQNVAFIDIPGNVDLAVKGNTLYADLYTALITLDISNPLNASLKNYSDNVFPYRFYSGGFYGDTSKIIVDWIKKDTSIAEDCNKIYPVTFYGGAYTLSPQGSALNNPPPATIGQGGSMARFTIVDNRMFTVSFSDLNVFNISNSNNPVFTEKVNLTNGNIETIFPYKNNLFIGSQNGMFIYNINNPDHPQLSGQFGHVRSCDPVIADDNYAYVTLRSGGTCQGFNNQLDILNLNLTNPLLVTSYHLTNPHGLSKDGNLLFICDGSDGLKVYDATSVTNLQLIKQFAGEETYDVIANNKIALVVAKDGLYQYDYSNTNDIHLISKLNIAQ